MKNQNVSRETHEQQALIKWGSYHPICSKHLISIPNGGSRNLIEAIRLKKEGVKPGVSDLFLAYPKGEYHGLWIEMKRKKGSVISIDQTNWIELMRSVKYAAYIAYGYEDAIDIIKQYLNESID